MTGPVTDRVVEYLARREEDVAGAAGWAELDPSVAREVAADWPCCEGGNHESH